MIITHPSKFIVKERSAPVSAPQGSLASPVLSCLYASEVLEKINANPIYSSEHLPVAPRSYVDDVGFLAISDSLEENIITLRHTLYKAEKHFNEIGMHIDPEKSDLMHFSWRKNDKKIPSADNHRRTTNCHHHPTSLHLLARVLPRP